MASDLTSRVFALVDTTDAAGFSRLFAPQGRLRFANNEPMTGPEAIEAGVNGFFTTIKGLEHTVLHEWADGSDTIVELSVDYHRSDGGTVTVPVVSIWRVDESGLIDDYRVYFDLAPVYA
ncbi:nuclear transport factor 2 family protein [Streptomyces sp. WI04-05B]|uniref:nuclear transport factor 2 family protein n=1 Tax=Streptomyces TaxID=1883 RepID=UPI0029B22CE4|nr:MULTISPECIES: nuclear transport factor 2 family protein [unclassified Streptomyces]MDX2548861.1 nuclear transport factor 2 family protein [Streptomyces sp. WI04-05B]MDX2587640.1 nuclear transport factor 2 family protein [Streptomyces sp. WI04-05A]MDX3748182.1 nuclear transport factor 2 family protein [Streptomyces sp. AK08-02]